MVRKLALTLLLTLSATPAFACINGMKTEEQGPPARSSDGPVTAQKKKAPRKHGARQVTTQASTPDYALLGLAGVGLAGLTSALVLRSRS